MSAKLPNGLTVQQDTFARAVAKGATFSDAAIAAGYAPKCAAQIGCRLFKNVKVKALIEHVQAKAAQTCDVDAAFVIKGLRENALRCQQAVPVLDKLGHPTGEYRFDSSGSNQAYALLGKSLGLFIDRSQVELSTDVKRIVERLAAIVAEEVTDMAIAERIVTRLAGEIGPGGSGPAR